MTDYRWKTISLGLRYAHHQPESLRLNLNLFITAPT